MYLLLQIAPLVGVFLLKQSTATMLRWIGADSYMLHLPRKAVSANDKDISFQQIAVPKVLSEEVREAISNNVLQFYVRDQQQEAQDEGINGFI